MNNTCFLTIGKTYESTESAERKKYIGVGSSYILSVNPDKKELEAIYNTEIANEPEYLTSSSDVKGVRVDFLVKTDPTVNCGIDAINRMSFFLYNEPQYNKDKTKVQVIDIYGNSSYALIEDAKQHKKLISANGKEMKISTQYRPAYRGEADLVCFLKTYLGIKDAFSFIDGGWKLKENACDFEFSLDNIKDYFSGNVYELKEVLSLQPKNKVKLLYGVRTTDKGQFQTICTHNNMFLVNNSGDKGLTYLEKVLAKAKLAGAFSDTEYRVCPLQEYTVKPTDLSTPEVDSSNDENPFEEDGLPF